MNGAVAKDVLLLGRYERQARMWLGARLAHLPCKVRPAAQPSSPGNFAIPETTFRYNRLDHI
jgi:hypothetical protein